MSRYRVAFLVWGPVLIACLASPGCRETPKPSAEAPAMPKTAPASPAEAPPPPEAHVEPPAPPVSQPAEAQAVKPELPKPEYKDVPPYRVVITVGSPDDPQAGWLHIESMTDKNQEANVNGFFPEPNIMEVDTNNVSELSLDLSMLPIKAKRRIILRIDKQGIELSQKHRGRILLSRGPTGHWTVATPLPP